jgi:hypothetical protein
MKKIIYLTIIIATCLFFIQNVFAKSDLANKLSGKILLQVEENGEAWYVEPEKQEKYFLNRPANAFEIMRKFGSGITNSDLEKIQIGLIDNNNTDTDMDGLSDNLEIAIGTDINIIDTDMDGYNDKEEISNSHDPLSTNKKNIDQDFSKLQSGKILLQVEKNGEAWYINGDDLKRYYLGRPSDAFNIMRSLGLGITTNDLNKIPNGYTHKDPVPVPPNQDTEITVPTSPEEAISTAAQAIRQDDLDLVLSTFTADMQSLVIYTMDFLDTEQKLTLANILSDTSLAESTDTKKTYKTEVYFNGEKHPINFYVEKQNNDRWLLTNL